MVADFFIADNVYFNALNVWNFAWNFWRQRKRGNFYIFAIFIDTADYVPEQKILYQRL